jgi:phosphoribosylaminoimidazolecarboxamide formyltransferase/IMP cyclohydrolase
VEVVLAPRVLEGARRALAGTTKVRVLEVPLTQGGNTMDFKRIGGGLLVQSPDARNVLPSELRTVTRKQPSAQQLSDLLFAWRVAKYVKSNAIVYCGGGMTLGVGAGQMSRVDSARIASIKAQNAGLTLSGSVVASDAFFPFRDGLDVIAASGAIAVIQPGGSMRDEEVIAAADEHGIAMLFTGVRHFRH